MKLTTCTECGADVVHCDNDTLLDFPAVPYTEHDAMWTIMSVGSMKLACVGNASPDGTGHVLHEHQLEESVMAS